MQTPLIIVNPRFFLFALFFIALSLTAQAADRGVKGEIIGPNGQPYHGQVNVTLIKKLKDGQSSTTASLRGPEFQHFFKGYEAVKWDFPFIVKVRAGSDGELAGEAWVTDPGGPDSYSKTAWVEVVLAPTNRR